MKHKYLNTCQDCFKALTAEEIEYYESRCEQCESYFAEQLQQWKAGSENKYFDDLYSAPKSILH